MEAFNSRRENFLIIQENLFRLQKTYFQAHSFLSQKLEALEPETEEDYLEWEELTIQLESCLSAIEKLEMIKNCLALGFLTEGSLITIEDLFKAIVLLEKFLTAVDEEKELLLSDDEYYIDFLNNKSHQLAEVKDVLEQLLSYKLERRHQFNVLEKH